VLTFSFALKFFLELNGILPKGDEGPNKANEAGIGVGVADKLAPDHD